jgi:hypothetical protein
VPKVDPGGGPLPEPPGWGVGSRKWASLNKTSRRRSSRCESRAPGP